MKGSVAYKKLSSLCKVQNGYAFDSKLFTTDSNDMPLVRIRDIKTGRTETFYKGDYSQEYVLHNGDYIIGMDGEFNITEWQGGEALLNQRVCRVIVSSEIVLPKYILYFLPIPLKKIEDETPFVTVKHLSSKKLNDVVVPVPSLENQQRIVDELDLLTGIIDKKNAQLRDLDALAQSIFYEMFGDPVTNEKGWPTAQLSSVSTLLNGRAYKQDELLNTGKYRVLRVGNFFTNSNYYYSDLELEDDKYCDNGDLLFAWSASFGAFIWSGEKVIYHYHIWKVLFDDAKLNKEFYRFLLNTMTSSFLNDVHGIGMVHLTKAGMEQYILPIPPMEKQEEFANKIASIEKQRTVIQASLDDANQLLTSRMSFYFE